MNKYRPKNLVKYKCLMVGKSYCPYMRWALHLDFHFLDGWHKYD